MPAREPETSRRREIESPQRLLPPADPDAEPGRGRYTTATNSPSGGLLSIRAVRQGRTSWLPPPRRQPSPPDRWLLLHAAGRRSQGDDTALARMHDTASSSIAACIHSLAWLRSFSRSSALSACPASRTQSRAKSSKSFDPDDIARPPIQVGSIGTMQIDIRWFQGGRRASPQSTERRLLLAESAGACRARSAYGICRAIGEQRHCDKVFAGHRRTWANCSRQCGSRRSCSRSLLRWTLPVVVRGSSVAISNRRGRL